MRRLEKQKPDPFGELEQKDPVEALI